MNDSFASGATVQLTPPPSNYDFDTLNQYFTAAIVNFFNYYTTNLFYLADDADGITLAGRTVSETGNYTVLDLEVVQADSASNAGLVGQHFQLYEPLFANNTDEAIPNVSVYPNAPSWLAPDLSESGSAMLLSANGVFSTVVPRGRLSRA